MNQVASTGYVQVKLKGSIFNLRPFQPQLQPQDDELGVIYQNIHRTNILDYRSVCGIDLLSIPNITADTLH